MPAFEQLQRGLRYRCAALGLEVGAVRAADAGAFVPMDAEPAKAVEDRLQRFGAIALGVGVIDAQDELAAMFPGEEPVEQGGANAADVQIAGGTRSKAGAYGHYGPGVRGQRSEVRGRSQGETAAPSPRFSWLLSPFTS